MQQTHASLFIGYYSNVVWRGGCGSGEVNNHSVLCIDGVGQHDWEPYSV